MSRRRPYKATILGGVFLGAALLRVILFPFYPSYSWQYLLIDILPSCLIYLLCGVIVFNMWIKLSFLQKAGFVGIGIHYILNFLYTAMDQFCYMERSLSTTEMWLSYYPWVILNPIEYLYDKFVLMPRTSFNATGDALTTIYLWETGLLLPSVRTVYSGLVGLCFGKLILLYRNGCLIQLVKESRRYSFIALISIFLGIFGYVLAFTSEEYFLIFLLLSVLSIVFGHISKRRIVRSNSKIKGKWLSITGLLLGYTLLAMAMIIFMRFNHYI
jgi:hypothetical protein